VIVVVPAATPTTSPPALTVAFDGAEDAHSVVAVGTGLPCASVMAPVNWSDTPATIVGFAGVIVISVGVGAGGGVRVLATTVRFVERVASGAPTTAAETTTAPARTPVTRPVAR
jgi:hypothetical protein